MTATLRTQDWPPLLRRLKDHGYVVKSLSSPDASPILRFSVDLSEWQLQFSDETPLFYALSASLPAGDDEFANTMRDVLRRHNVQEDCFVVTDRDAVELKRELGQTLFPRIVVCDARDQSEVLAAHSVTHALRKVVTSQFELTDLVPYHIGGRDSRFFGRHEELNRILRHEAADFAITGIRRVGKTFLLNEAFRKMKAARPDEPAPLVYDCATFRQPHDFIRSIVHDLDIRQYNRRETAGWSYFDGVTFLKNQARARKRHIILFLDECDQLIELAHQSPDLLEMIRASINNGSCRYIVAGFQRLLLETGDVKSPLYLRFETIRLQPFDRDETRHILLDPLTALGVQFEEQEKTVQQLYDDTGGMPPLVQYYCGEMTKILQKRRDRTIRVSDFGMIHSAAVLKSVVLDSFRDSVSKEDQLLIYILLQRYGPKKGTYTQEEMSEALEESGWPLDWAKVDQACDRLLLAGFLTRDGHTFHFTMPTFATLVFRYHNLKYTIDSLKKELRKP